MEIKVKAYNEKVQTALQVLLGNTMELNDKASVDFEMVVGDPAIYNILGNEASVTFVTRDITVQNEAGEDIVLETLKDYVYTIEMNGETSSFVAQARARQLPAVGVAHKIFAVLLNAKKVELGLSAVKAARQPSEARQKREKLQAEKLLLAQLRAKKKAKVAVEAADVDSESDEDQTL